MFQRNANATPGSKNAQTAPSKIKAKAKARPKRPPSGLAGVQLYGNSQRAGGMNRGSAPC